MGKAPSSNVAVSAWPRLDVRSCQTGGMERNSLFHSLSANLETLLWLAKSWKGITSLPSGQMLKLSRRRLQVSPAESVRVYRVMKSSSISLWRRLGQTLRQVWTHTCIEQL